MSDTAPAPVAFYRPAEVARMLRCSEWWVKEQARRRRIPYCWIGGSYLFTPEHIAAIVRLFEVEPTDGPARPAVDVGSERTVSARAGDAAVVPLHARPPRRRRKSSVSTAGRSEHAVR